MGGTIHIVAYDHIEEYLEMVEPSDYDLKEDFLITNQKSLLQKLDSDFAGHVLGGMPKKPDNTEF